MGKTPEVSSDYATIRAWAKADSTLDLARLLRRVHAFAAPAECDLRRWIRSTRGQRLILTAGLPVTEE